MFHTAIKEISLLNLAAIKSNRKSNKYIYKIPQKYP